MIALDTHGQFVTTEGKQLGVYAYQRKGRWTFVNSSGDVYGSGITPAEFCREFWLRDDYSE